MSVGACTASSGDGARRLPTDESLRKPCARVDTGRMLSSIALTRARSLALAVASNSGGVASTTLIT